MASGFMPSFSSGLGSGLGSSITGFLDPSAYIDMPQSAQGANMDYFTQKQMEEENKQRQREWQLTKLLGMENYYDKKSKREWKQQLAYYLSKG